MKTKRNNLICDEKRNDILLKSKRCTNTFQANAMPADRIHFRKDTHKHKSTQLNTTNEMIPNQWNVTPKEINFVVVVFFFK